MRKKALMESGKQIMLSIATNRLSVISGEKRIDSSNKIAEDVPIYRTVQLPGYEFVRKHSATFSIHV